MKNNLISISLATATAPIVQEARGKDWIEFSEVMSGKTFTLSFLLTFTTTLVPIVLLSMQQLR
jgi:hypothetical protein